MDFFNLNRSIFTELKDTNPQQLISNNKQLENHFVLYLSVVRHIYDCAQQLLDEFFAGEQAASPDAAPTSPTFPIPVREIAKRCNFQLFEMEMADTDSMEQDEYGGGRTTIAQMQMRERIQIADDNGLQRAEIAGTIVVDRNLSEYDKRFAIAHELGHYVLRTLNPIGPLFIEDSCPGPFAYVPVKEFLANEFAYALLLPYSLVKERKKRYERENQYNPLNYMDWIQVLENEAQLPQCYVILAYEEVKKRQLAEIMELQSQMVDQQQDSPDEIEKQLAETREASRQEETAAPPPPQEESPT